MGNIGRGLGCGEALALSSSRKTSAWPRRHVGVGLAFGRHIAEMAPAIDHLLGRAAADAELQPAAGDEVGGAGVLGHVERVLVAHVDDGGADLDAAGAGADRGEQREGRGELPGEMMHAEICAVRAQLLRRDGEIDRLQQRVGRPSACRECGEGVQWPKERKPIFFMVRGLGLLACPTERDLRPEEGTPV